MGHGNATPGPKIANSYSKNKKHWLHIHQFLFLHSQKKQTLLHSKKRLFPPLSSSRGVVNQLLTAANLCVFCALIRSFMATHRVKQINASTRKKKIKNKANLTASLQISITTIALVHLSGWKLGLRARSVQYMCLSVPPYLRIGRRIWSRCAWTCRRGWCTGS